MNIRVAGNGMPGTVYTSMETPYNPIALYSNSGRELVNNSNPLPTGRMAQADCMGRFYRRVELLPDQKRLINRYPMPRSEAVNRNNSLSFPSYRFNDHAADRPYNY